MINKKDKKMSILTRAFFIYGCNGIIWFGLGLCEIFEFPKALKFIILFLVLISVILELKSIFVKSDIMDEMAIIHQRKAYANVFMELMLALSLVGIYVVLSDSWVIDLVKVYPFIIGILNILIFLHFWYFEKVGD